MALRRPSTKGRKVVQLKTVQQIKADLLLVQEELSQARSTIRRQEAQIEAGNAVLLREKTGFAGLLMKIRDTIAAEEEFDGAMPLRMRVKTMFFPEFMMRWAARATKARIGQRVFSAIQEYTFQKHHEVPETAISKAIATTIKVDKGE
jgi:hypothetical protein